MNELALFAGAGGGLLASELLGFNTVAAVEIGEYPREVLLARQADGMLPKFPIWDDVQTFDGEPWRGKIDIVTGGFPCQDISSTGTGKGLTGERSGLWREYKRIVGEIRPPFVFAENSPLLRTRGLGTVIKDLTELGYNVRWGVLGAGHLGALHQRKRMWVLASNMLCDGLQRDFAKEIHRKPGIPWESGCRGIEDFRRGSSVPLRGLLRGSNGIPKYVDRIRAIGNAQVPAVAATAFRLLSVGL